MAATLRRLPRAALEKRGWTVRVLVVDGASTDGTPEAARAGGAEVLVEPRRGYGRAYKAGFAVAGDADVVVTADADDTYPLDQLPDLLDGFQKDRLDFATVNRFAGLEKGAMTATNRFGNGILNLAARILFGVRIRDSQSGMWILSRRALGLLPAPKFSEGMPFSQEIKLWSLRSRALRGRELPGRYYPRIGEEKLLRWRDGFGNLWRLLRFRFRRL